MTAVARRTGLSAHVIRIWEKRYGAIKPSRAPNNRRLYSEEEITRLSLLRDVTRAGHSIGAVANLPLNKLRKLAKAAAVEISPSSPSPLNFLEECISAIRRLDGPALDVTLKRASVELGTQGMLVKLVAPLTKTIGDLWCNGSITIAQEHLASDVLRGLLSSVVTAFAESDHTPLLVVATPAGQLHELGALLVRAAAVSMGWRVAYMGPSLPAAEIAGAVRQTQARALALSIVYPPDDPGLDPELKRLRELLPPDFPILVGGLAALSYETTLKRIRALLIEDLSLLWMTLDNLRKPAKRK